MLYCVAGTFRRLSRLFFFSSSPLSERLSSSIPVVELSSRLLARNNPSQLPKGRRRRLFVKVGAVHLQQVSGLEWLLAEFARQRYSAFHRLLLVGVAKLSGIFCSVDCFAFDPGLLLFLLLLQCWRMIAIEDEDDSDGCSGINPIPCFLNLWVRKKNLLQNSLQRISQNASVLMRSIWRRRSGENNCCCGCCCWGPSEAEDDANQTLFSSDDSSL